LWPDLRHVTHKGIGADFGAILVFQFSGASAHKPRCASAELSSGFTVRGNVMQFAS
jgi:hypothetical protein